MASRPPMIRADHTNPFAHDTMLNRVPATVRETLALNPDYPPPIQESLKLLESEIASNAPIPMLHLLAPDYESWDASYALRPGATWHNVDWFFAETFFYRHLIQAVRWWETGHDPFTPKKTAELGSGALWSLLEGVLALKDMSPNERLHSLLHADLWGNRIDLSFAASLEHGAQGSHDDLLSDDAPKAVDHLMGRSGAIHLIADNTGTELAMDFVLADALLERPGNNVIFHLKMHPTFVSDAIVADAHILLGAMREQGGTCANLAHRLGAALENGRLRFAPDFFWNSAYLLWDMPARFGRIFRDATLVIIKGDANYRRMVGDALWPADTSFADVTAYFPAPLLALRTLKSDPVVGLASGLAEKLDGLDAQWRVNGRRGVIQFKP
ncbi:MAG: protein-glutamate O-methyltransferase family protein [Anaerolineae bacterium]|nr:protein-glutamate O-methyltransferase family protein [Anaerolineae bacterium]